MSSAFTPLPASGYTCIAAGDSPRSSIINVHRVSQVEAPKSIYSTAFRTEGQVHRAKRNRVRSFVRTRLSINMGSNASEVRSDGILQALNPTRRREAKIDLFSSFAGWLTNAVEEERWR